MKWIRHGKKFSPEGFDLPNQCINYAQSPQALILRDFIRVYFSTRELDSDGKYRSHIAFVDFEEDFKEIIGVSKQEVIPLGELGSFDEHGIFPFNVLQDGDRILAYTSGWNRRVSVPVDGAIGLAESKDGGETFQRIGKGPLLAASLNEPFLVGDGFVRFFNGRYYMWYIHGLKWIQTEESMHPERIYKITYAVSEDAINWQRQNKNIIPNRLGEDECQALPSVAFYKEKYHMFFCYREASDFRKKPERSYKIGYAYSADLENWIRDDSLFSFIGEPQAWDANMQCYPHVFKYRDTLYLLYNGNEFGREGFGLAVLANN